MKKFFVMAMVALASLGASAEGLYVGGSLGFYHEGSSDNSHAINTFTILPEVGYNLTDKFALGTTIGFESQATCRTGISSNMFQFNPYARFTYFKSDNNLINLFVDGGIDLGLGWVSTKDDSSDTGVIYGIGFRPGVAINITDKFSFVTHVGFLGYKGANDTAKMAGYKNQGGLSLDSRDLTFGFYYNF